MSPIKFQEMAGGATALGLIGTPATSSAKVSPRYGLETFDHVVVLMLENRSFDNLLGYLYDPLSVPRNQSFEGVLGKDLSNPIPLYADQADRWVVRVEKGYEMDSPNPDPGEEYTHVNTQLYGTVLPEQNRYKRSALQAVSPFNLPKAVASRAPMNGFLMDYIDNFRASVGRDPGYNEYKKIMHCFAPDAVPVISTLAQQFAVCDHWHCEVPSQTFCNRSFFHAGSSSGYVVNAPYAKWVKGNNAQTIFDRIQSAEDRGLSWKIYYDKEDVFSLTGLIHYPRLKERFGTNFFPMESFFEDAREGTLPSYAFLEPRFFLDHSDMHPPIAILDKTIPSTVLSGEQLINAVYEAVRVSDNSHGSNYQNTLLIITFDEHGGCYDHVAPPSAIPPDPGRPAGEFGFSFDRLGVRVPSILISAYIEPGTVINSPLQHTSVIKTLCEKWSLQHLTERDRTATGITEAINRCSPRERDDWPVLSPRSSPNGDADEAWNASRPLNGLQKHFLELVNAIAGETKGPLVDIFTVYQAVDGMRKIFERVHASPATPRGK